MDLAYPSQPDLPAQGKSVAIQKRRSFFLKPTNPNLPYAPSLPQHLKKKVMQYLHQDFPYELKQYIDKQVISFRAQIGRQGSYQNLLHTSCRQNAVKCLQYILKTFYEQQPQDYQNYVNSQSKQGLTPAMVAVLAHSNQSLKFLLKMGAIDIHLIDSNKLSTYQLALNSKNQQAVKMLMDYDTGNKKPKSVNRQALQVPIQLKKGKIGLCQGFFKYMFDCFSCKQEISQKNLSLQKAKRSTSKLTTTLQNLFNKDNVQIGFTAEELNCQIQWKSVSMYQNLNNQCVLYDTFCAFDMQDIGKSMPNFLIAFQSLSQYPWLVRRIIQKDAKSANYIISLYQKNTQQLITVNDQLPFMIKTMQPIFIADKKEAWPMLLQKGMAKALGSYAKLQSFSMQKILQTLTGWPVIRKDFQKQTLKIQNLQNLVSQGFMVILQGRNKSLLSHPKCILSYFSILNYYCKNNKRLVLINCPFIDPAWVEKQRHEILALKMLRGHYNCRQQMTIWIEQQRLAQYFSSIIVCPIKSGYRRESIQIKVTQWVYFSLQIQGLQQQNACLYLIEKNIQKLMNEVTFQGWRNQKQKIKLFQTDLNANGLYQFQAKQGEYLLRAKVNPGEYYLFCWSSSKIKLQFIQQSFGIIEWIGCRRKQIMKNWTSQSFVLEKIQDFTIFIKKGHSSALLQIQGEIHQGHKQPSGAIKLVQENQFGYCLVRGNIQKMPATLEL